MAAAEPLQAIKEEVTCPICQELFQDPVTSECGHSFCRECITWHCQGDGDVACPLCKEKLQERHLRPNRELRNIVELVKSQPVEDSRGWNMCETHRERLRFYCTEDETPVCLACERSRAHHNHTVVPMEEAVQNHRAHTEGPRQRFADAASQPQPRDPVWRGVSPGREAAGETESQGPAGREPGSEPAAETWGETRTHVVHVCEEASTSKEGLDQASLDPNIHTISNTTGAAEHKVDTEGLRKRFADAASQPQPRDPDWRGVSPGGEAAGELESQGPAGREPSSEREHGRKQASLDLGFHMISITTVFEKFKAGVMAILIRFLEWLFPDLWKVSAGDQAGVSPAGQGAAQTESGGHTGRGGRESQDPEAAAAGVPIKAKPAPLPPKEPNTLPPSQKQQQVDVKGRRSRFDSPTSPAPWQVSAGDQAGVSPAGQGAAQTELGGDTGRGGRESQEPEAAAAGVPIKVDVKSLVRRFDSPTSPGRSQVSAGDQAGVSPAGQGAAQTESGGDTGRGGRESQELEAAAAGVRRKAKPAPGLPKQHNTLPRSWKQQQADAPSRGDSFQGQSPLSPELPSGCSGQVGVSPGGRVARPPELQGCAVEVTLDPATAHPRLVLSEDRKSVERGDTWQDLPNNPERFDTCVCVLGSEGFTSGRRYWEVEVGSRGGWAIGVARDSVQRKEDIQLKPDLGIWALDSLDVRQVPRKVGVYLDYEGGEVRFYNAETMALISSRTATFTGRLVPFFRLWATGSRISLSPSQR